jgi:hypothetical protein
VDSTASPENSETCIQCGRWQNECECDILDLVEGKLLAMLRSNEEVPAHVLEKLYAHRLKRREQERANEPDEVREEATVLDYIREAGLPLERKVELVEREVDRLIAELDQAEAFLRMLRDGGEATAS